MRARPGRLRRARAAGAAVEGRIEDDMLRKIAADAGGRALAFRRLDVGRDDADAVGEAGVGGPRQRLAGAADGNRIALDENHPRPLAARRDAEAGDADAGTEIGDRAADAGFERGGEDHGLEAGAVVAGGRLDGLD